jgi:hypothetical protein
MGLWLVDAVETLVLQVWNSRREAEPQQRAERENMVGDAAIGVVTIGHDIGPVIKQRIQDMPRFASGCRDRLDVERRVETGDVSVELGSWIVAVMNIEIGGGAALAAGRLCGTSPGSAG